jgi:hypothetical protein
MFTNSGRKEILHMFYMVLYLIALALSTKQLWIISSIKVHLAHESTNNNMYLKSNISKETCSSMRHSTFFEPFMLSSRIWKCLYDCRVIIACTSSK